jgi:predicted DNA-binding ribbon-helix-helix protein
LNGGTAERIAGSTNLSRLIKRSFRLAGHRTSVALEPAFWDVLHGIARSLGVSLAELVASVDAERDGTASLASSLRVLALLDALAHRTSPTTDTDDEAPGLR